MKLSTQRTSWPSARNRSHRCDPMNPAPPVMSVRTADSFQETRARGTQTGYETTAANQGFAVRLVAEYAIGRGESSESSSAERPRVRQLAGDGTSGKTGPGDIE